ncbi:MAG: phosphoribosyltransferase [Alphaproteobacteria bacterium]
MFRDRTEAGQLLARRLIRYKDQAEVIVLGLARGGMPVASEVAKALRAPLDVFLVRKLGVPGQEELAMGASASGNVRVLNDPIINALGISPAAIEAAAAKEEREIERRERLYRGDRPSLAVENRTIILIDDGLATGSTMRAAVLALRRQHPASIIVAVPVAAASTCEDLKHEVEEIVCLLTPENFFAVGEWYEDFSQITDEEVQELLRCAPVVRSSTDTLRQA